MEQSARIFKCAQCQQSVFICSHCDHGQRYCCQACAQFARQQSLKMANARYQDTFSGRHHHADRQRRYRMRQKNQSLQEAPKKVTYHPSKGLSHCDLLPNTTGGRPLKAIQRDPSPSCCHFCSKPVQKKKEALWEQKLWQPFGAALPS